jgi:hypothetical protein
MRAAPSNIGREAKKKYRFKEAFYMYIFHQKTMAADDSGTTVDRPTYRKNYNYPQPARAHS